MKHILLICCLVTGFFSSAQEGIIPEVFPPSPSASELGKYGTYPVDLSTGLPKIEIPLYTIEVGDLKIPIKLKYHASGIKVNQMPSWVGLGWSLDTGGLISLDVRDTPDEVEPNPYSIPSLAYIENFIFPYPYNFENYALKNVTNNSWIKDAYHISLPTVSGTFFLGTTNSSDGIGKFPPDQYTVEKDIHFSSALPGSPYKFLVKDKQGVQYYFKDVEQSEMLKTTNQPGDDNHIYNKKYNSAWLPNKISDTKGNSINFIYGNTYTVPSRGETHSQTYSYSEGVDGYRFYNASIQPWKVGLSKSLNYANKPTEINFSNGRIRFVMGSNSLFDGVKDAPGKYLQKIIIERGDSSTGYTVVKTLMFEYSVTGSASLLGKYRFKLDKVIEWNGFNSNEQIEKASFEYSPLQLPKIGSYSVDFFGLYNGKINTNLIPAKVIHYKPTQYGGEHPETIGAGDRSVNTSFMKAGMLTKIIYPTKGYTTFNYETNSYYGFNQTLQEEYISESIALFGEGNGSQNPSNIICFDESCVIKSQEISLPVNSSTSLRITGNSLCNNCDVTNSKYSYAKVWLNGNLIFNGYKSNIDFSVNLPAGNNYLLAKVYGDRVTLHLNMGYWNSPEPGNYANIEGFGLHNNKITNFDSNGIFISQKAYDFTIPGTTQSSGKLINGNLEFKNLNTFRSSVLIMDCEPSYIHYINTTSYTYSSSSKTGFENNGIAYEYVTETDKDSIGNTNGKVIYQFSAVPDLNTNVPAVWLSQGHKRGNLLTKEVYDQQNRLIVKEENSYSEDPLVKSSRLDFNAKISAFSDYTPFNCTNIMPYDVRDELIFFYTDLTSYWYKKNRTEVTNYFYNGNLSEEIKDSFDYIYNNHNQEIEKVVSTDSNGDPNKKKYYYAWDKSNQRLIDENRISVPLEIITLKNSLVIGDHLTTYGTFGNLYLPNAVYRKKDGLVNLSSISDRTLGFTRYDSKGNALEVSRPDGPSLVYLWGYEDQRPIAKIENATYQEAANALRISTTTLDNYNESNLGNINSLRTNGNLPDAMITTYTYDPLIGVTSVTNPKGYTTYYEYDNFNRLKYVKDADGNIVKEQKYNYKNQ